MKLFSSQAQVALNEPQPNRPELYQDIDTFLANRIKQSRFMADHEWIPILHDAHKHYGSGKSEVVAKVWYLSCVMQYPLYGCTQFSANYRGNFLISLTYNKLYSKFSDCKTVYLWFIYIHKTIKPCFHVFFHACDLFQKIIFKDWWFRKEILSDRDDIGTLSDLQ